MPRFAGRHAIVVGAGIGGLAAAKALAEYFEQVTIMERDALPARPEPRRGTPQSRHPHLLLAGGQAALDELFPGITGDIERAGAETVRNGFDIWTERPGFDPFPVRDLGFNGFCLSRPLLEFVVRERVRQQHNIILMAHCRVLEVTASPDQATATGVRYSGPDDRAVTLGADFVVDASGRGALTLDLLDGIGAARPEETEIGIDLAYSTAIFARPEREPVPWKGLLHMPLAPDSSRGALILPMENKQWIVVLVSAHGDVPPGDIEGYFAFAKGFRTSTVHDAISNAKCLGEVVRYNFPSSVWRHFETLPRFPRGLIPVADAICRFNPAFGQGMSVAAQEACALKRLLDERQGLPDPLDGLAQAFFASIQDLLDAPWRVAENDFIFPQTRGQRPEDFEQRLRYRFALMRIAANDPAVHKTLAEVNSLLKPPSALREPKLAKRVMEVLSNTSRR